MSKKKGEIPALPIEVVQERLGRDIEWTKANGSPTALMQLMSIAEYLKDARRWHYAQGHVLPEMSGEALKKFVDQEIGQ